MTTINRRAALLGSVTLPAALAPLNFVLAADEVELSGSWGRRHCPANSMSFSGDAPSAASPGAPLSARPKSVA